MKRIHPFLSKVLSVVACFLVIFWSASAQETVKITGVVSDAEGPLPGVSANVFGEYEIIDNLKFELTFNVDYESSGSETFRPSTIPNHNALDISVSSGSNVNSASYNIQPHKLFFPIQEREVRLNGFEQNPNWESLDIKNI